jgi:hypothetical protein
VVVSVNRQHVACGLWLVALLMAIASAFIVSLKISLFLQPP